MAIKLYFKTVRMLKRYGYEGVWSCLEHRMRHAFIFTTHLKSMMVEAMRMEAKESDTPMKNIKFELTA